MLFSKHLVEVHLLSLAAHPSPPLGCLGWLMVEDGCPCSLCPFPTGCRAMASIPTAVVRLGSTSSNQPGSNFVLEQYLAKEFTDTLRTGFRQSPLSSLSKLLTCSYTGCGNCSILFDVFAPLTRCPIMCMQHYSSYFPLFFIE